MVAPKNQFPASLDAETYPLGEKSEHPTNGSALALVALSHTPIEQRIYQAMLLAPIASATNTVSFTARRLMLLTGIRSLSTIRRGLEGLVTKLSIVRNERSNGNGGRENGVTYSAHAPEEILSRRNRMGFCDYSSSLEARAGNHAFERAITQVTANPNLSRREAQVALCCVEGLTNAEIGSRLQVSEQTVKFHLRHIFIKFGVKRRAELISRLLT